MSLFELTIAVTKAGFFQPHKVVSSPPTKSKQIAMQPIPEMDNAARRGCSSQFQRQGTVA
jgi:hypothetical protein